MTASKATSFFKPRFNSDFKSLSLLAALENVLEDELLDKTALAVVQRRSREREAIARMQTIWFSLHYDFSPLKKIIYT
ncbi:uncharacterized protein PHALS_11609 [Plasmopara halstedii]|uniref:Uncharacterized protein n=1 Tax=Plasmopara halstedii TaxID=4781 RepID=A0A0P1AIS9_PLAHL|nr:uncharacterized protein PHALS_11609 [Plasmopara halstedii]CEG41249.1 hypothetical protein PHALS_11609 [Plasmopara halstedii]|eukprot:XP_024577618.1 hypothetical protein PHALS_11609 [Plasmopara halstedii]